MYIEKAFFSKLAPINIVVYITPTPINHRHRQRNQHLSLQTLRPDRRRNQNCGKEVEEKNYCLSKCDATEKM